MVYSLIESSDFGVSSIMTPLMKRFFKTVAMLLLGVLNFLRLSKTDP